MLFATRTTRVPAEGPSRRSGDPSLSNDTPEDLARVVRLVFTPRLAIEIVTHNRFGSMKRAETSEDPFRRRDAYER